MQRKSSRNMPRIPLKYVGDSFWAAAQGAGIQTEPGNLAEVKRMKSGRPRELELKGQSFREEDLQRSALGFP